MYTRDIDRAIFIASKQHAEQKDKSGKPYILHPLRVMMRLGEHASETERIAAVLHDVVEDTDMTIGDVWAAFNEKVANLVSVLTRRPLESHTHYMQQVCRIGLESAMRVKLADVYDNMSPSRIATLPESEKGLLKRYERDSAMLRACLGGADIGIISGDLNVW